MADPAKDELASVTAGNRQPARVPRRANWRLRLFVALGLFAVMLVGTAGFMAAQWLAEFKGKERPSTRTVVVAIQELARLEGAEYHMERVIDLKETQTRLFGLLKADDAVLLVAAGSVIAGTDLAPLGEGDVEMSTDRTEVTVKLPHSRVLVSRLDNERTYVYERRTDLLAERKEGLEAKAREEAEKTLVQAATEAGLLDRSDASIKRTVESLLRSLGFAEVTVEFR